MLAPMLPRLGSSKLISTWIWITLVASIAAAVSGGLMGWAALAPARIWRGEVWRLATWVFVEPGALALILTCGASTSSAASSRRAGASAGCGGS